MLRKLLAGLGLGTLAAVLVLGLAASTDLAERLELTTYDWRMRLAADPASVSKDIVLVELNDASLREMSGLFGRWPWPRVATSYVLDFLKRAPAKVIAVDIQFTELDKVAQYDFAGDPWTGRQSDNALVRSVKEAGNVVLLADAVYQGLVGEEKDATAASWPTSGYPAVAGVQRPLVLAPFQSLTDASAALGHNFLTTDDRRTGPPDVAVRTQRRQGHALTGRCRRLARWRIRAEGCDAGWGRAAHPRPARAARQGSSRRH